MATETSVDEIDAVGQVTEIRLFDCLGTRLICPLSCIISVLSWHSWRRSFSCFCLCSRCVHVCVDHRDKMTFNCCFSQAQTSVYVVCGWPHWGWDFGSVTGFLNNMICILVVDLNNRRKGDSSSESVNHPRFILATESVINVFRDHFLLVILHKLPSVAVCVSAICTGLMWVTGGKCSNQCLLMVSLSV